ncbi:MAG: hypothetical protein D6683_04045 [Actinomyces sp.]|nr:MAG: hypothetical protein D6683_04045 [Actinomyces sp.]
MFAARRVRVETLDETGVDAYGEPAESWAQLTAGIPATVVEVAANTSRTPPVGQEQATPMRRFTGRVPARVAVKVGDRVVDEATGEAWIVDAVTGPSPVIGAGWRRLDMHRANRTQEVTT